MPETTTSPDERLFRLAAKLSEAKRQESDAKTMRLAIEQEIIAATGFTKASGSQSFGVDGDFGLAKLSLKQPVSTNVVADMLPAVKKAIGPAVFKRVFRVKHEVIAAGLTALEKEDRDTYLLVADALVRKPGKVAVELKNLEVR